MNKSRITQYKSPLSFCIGLLLISSSASATASNLLGENYMEPVHIRIEGNSIKAPAQVYIQPDQFKKYRIELQWIDNFHQLADSAGMKADVIDHLKIKDYLNPFSESLGAKLSCDQPFILEEQKGLYSTQTPNQDSFRISKTSAGNSKTSIILSPLTQKCSLSIKDDRPKSKVKNKDFSIKLTRNPVANVYLNSLSTASSICNKVSNPKKEPLLSAFTSIIGPQTTCTYPLESIQNLENKIDGLQGKMNVLLGAPLSAEFLAKKDPYAPLDFSHAPKLDAILISYLVFRADYTGFLIARALEHHAKQGTQIRILVTEAISLYKDKALLDRLLAASPNIKVQLYRWKNIQNAGEGGPMATFHRAVHSKLFITLSKNDARQNSLIHGGRNLHDGFALTNSVSASAMKNPFVNYGDKATDDETWASWRDFELEIRDPAFVTAVAEHYMRLWNRNAETNVMGVLKKTYVNNKAELSKTPYALAKHLVSVPFQDGHLLEAIYERLIDSAQKEIIITSPYLRPPKRVFNALMRAIDRGVKLKIITRIDLHGDTADDFLEEVNKFAINKLYDHCEVYEYTVKSEILHSKLMIIDQTLSFVSSVNQNQRSYIHDIEDGILLYSPEYAKRLVDLVNTYRASTRLVTEKVKTVWWRRLVVNIFKSEF